MKIISSTHYNRPKCTKLMLDHLERCYHIEDYKIICCVEPGCQEVYDILAESKLNVEIVQNRELLGLWPNKKQAVGLAFEQADYAIFLEDDVLLSKDALLYFEWCNREYRDSDDVFTISSWYKVGCDHLNSSADIPNLVRKVDRYNPLGWATWRRIWDEIKDEWNGQDAQLQDRFRAGRKCIFPVLSRSQNISYEVGETSHPDLEKTLRQTGHSPKFRYNDKLYTNNKGREWVKLDENTVKSRIPSQEYKEEYYLDIWADAVEYEHTGVFREEVENVVIRMRPDWMIPGLHDLIKYISDNGHLGTMVEVGCYAGESTELFAQRFTKLFAVDPWFDVVRNSGFQYPHRMIDVERHFDNRCGKYANITKIKARSMEAIGSFADNSLDFVYLDGCHEYHSVIEDLQWIKKIKSGAFIGGHDYKNNRAGLDKAILEQLGGPDVVFSDTSWIKRV